MTDTLSNNASNNDGPFPSGKMVTVYVCYLTDEGTNGPELELWSNLNQEDPTEWVASPFHPARKGGEGTYVASTNVWIKPVDGPTEYSYTVRGRDDPDGDWVWLSSFRNPANNTIEVVPPVKNPNRKKGWRLSTWRKKRKAARKEQSAQK